MQHLGSRYSKTRKSCGPHQAHAANQPAVRFAPAAPAAHTHTPSGRLRRRSLCATRFVRMLRPKGQAMHPSAPGLHSLRRLIIARAGGNRHGPIPLAGKILSRKSLNRKIVDMAFLPSVCNANSSYFRQQTRGAAANGCRRSVAAALPACSANFSAALRAVLACADAAGLTAATGAAGVATARYRRRCGSGASGALGLSRSSIAPESAP